jgi:cytochrome c oxidase subunit 2
MARPVAPATIAVACLIALVVAGCMPAPASDQARAVADLWTQFLVAAALVGGLVWVLMTIAIIRFRKRPGQDGLPSQVADSKRLELAWTIGPILIVAVLFLLTLGALGRVDARVGGAVTVDITAFRWQWRFDYPGSGVSVAGGPAQPAVLVVPVGEPIHFILTSSDVAHSFYVPAFLFKRDAIPGRTNEFDVTIDEPGSYGGQCAEFCGVFHDRMLLTVQAVTRPEYDSWLAAQARGSAAPGAANGSPATPGSAGASPVAAPAGTSVAP